MSAAGFQVQPPSCAQVLLEAGVLDQTAADRAAQVARESGVGFVNVVHQLALAPDEAVCAALATGLGLERASEADLDDLPEALAGLSTAFLRRSHVIPLCLAEDSVIVGTVDPEETAGTEAIGFATGLKPVRRLLTFEQWRRAFERTCPAEAAGPAAPRAVEGAWAEDATKVRDQREAAPAVRLVDRILEQALQRGASDIHIEPLPDRLRVRFRVNGELTVISEEPAHMAASVAARIKILANMDVADRRAPQDGRTSLAALGRPVDVRISTVPGVHGETVALRLLRREEEQLDLNRLGFSQEVISLLEGVLALRRGLFLVTGPTGSGKTTTLYAMIQKLRRQPLKILSIEDPIEYFFPDITQTQVNEAAGVTFATALRSFLRQDPDVILVGEIRDPETAAIAIQAALTGHLVLATLHTADAPSAVTRLIDMGVDRYLVSATLNAVISQRLTPALCRHCRRSRSLSELERAFFADAVVSTPAELFDAPGCPHCRGSGQQGRLALGEGFRVTEVLREAMADPTGLALEAALRDGGYRALSHDAVRLASEGAIGAADLRALMLA